MPYTMPKTNKKEIKAYKCFTKTKFYITKVDD